VKGRLTGDGQVATDLRRLVRRNRCPVSAAPAVPTPACNYRSARTLAVVTAAATQATKSPGTSVRGVSYSLGTGTTPPVRLHGMTGRICG
jgi:hypothetical protein